MYSPVWQDNDPAYDVTEYWSDWEYYSDDYYDQLSPKKRRRNAEAVGDTTGTPGTRANVTGSTQTRKRRKFKSMDEISELSLGESVDSEMDGPAPARHVVVWRSKSPTNKTPVVMDGQGEKVALLKDWKDMLKAIPKQTQSGPQPKSSKPTERAVAVVIERRCPEERDTSTKMKTSTKHGDAKAKGKKAHPLANGRSTTVSFNAKQKFKPSNDPSSSIPAITTNGPPNGKITLAHRTNGLTNGRKRKAPESTEVKTHPADNETEEQTGPRKRRSVKMQDNETRDPKPREPPPSKVPVSEPPQKKKATSSTGRRTPLNPNDHLPHPPLSKPSGRRRKVPEITEPLKPSANPKATQPAEPNEPVLSGRKRKARDTEETSRPPAKRTKSIQKDLATSVDKKTPAAGGRRSTRTKNG
ncbi:hypothetical protein MMC12_003281 [Toensbergia leucococca]|nr:hypothetical protein [Toensbergia leucococca]